ncbi:Clp protease N-terminal domain-containing protein [Kribbella sp.]|uniref:Clp protease N-terminal domain-containing protein n=1 Tax=Kribbella sp. TaxID=1871183 RepID=UPI002D387165|nr:Clp protease N-terminal domain-containing protein [Kribbella sp.]HZX01671.1 Clp protease N-terminal domain-containing protein [Kribbella sp.]
MPTDIRSTLVRSARHEARRDGSRTVEAEHLLLAIALLEDNAATRMLTAAGLTEDVIRSALNREWEQSLAVAGIAVRIDSLPQATPDRDRQPQFGESGKLVLRRAMEAPPKLGSRIGPMRILVGLLDTERGRVARTLEAAGVNRVALRTQAAEALASGTN